MVLTYKYPYLIGNEPLAYRIRPKAIQEIIGQAHLLKENGVCKVFTDGVHKT